MKTKKRKNGRHLYFSFLVTFAALVVLFAAALIVILSDSVSTLAIDDDSAYNGASDGSYDFVETEGRNGVKYYLITSTSAQTTAARTTTASGDDENVTATAAAASSSRKTRTTAASTKAASETAATAGVTVGSLADSSDDASTAEDTDSSSSSLRDIAGTTKTQKRSDEKIAYLTFDDGPSINTEKLLDILDRYNVKATFFVIYHRNMEKRYKAIADRGHTIALHSYTHNYSKIYKTEKGYYNDLNKIHDYVEKVTGVDSRIIRFPGGSSNTVSRKYNKTIMSTLKKSVTKKGYVYHDWNIDSSDASGINRDPDLLVSRVEAGLKKKKPVVDILMHDTGKSKTTTVEALPRIIEAVQNAGYRIEPLTIDSQPIQHNW